jgi:hypothetical protein
LGGPGSGGRNKLSIAVHALRGTGRRDRGTKPDGPARRKRPLPIPERPSPLRRRLSSGVKGWYVRGDVEGVSPFELVRLRQQLRATPTAEAEWAARHGLEYRGLFAHVWTARARAAAAADGDGNGHGHGEHHRTDPNDEAK